MSKHLKIALDMVEFYGKTSYAILPGEPTDEMISAASDVSTVSHDTVELMYAAMLRAYLTAA